MDETAPRVAALSRPPPCCGWCRWGWRVDVGLGVGVVVLVWWLVG